MKRLDPSSFGGMSCEKDGDYVYCSDVIEELKKLLPPKQKCVSDYEIFLYEEIEENINNLIKQLD